MDASSELINIMPHFESEEQNSIPIQSSLRTPTMRGEKAMLCYILGISIWGAIGISLVAVGGAFYGFHKGARTTIDCTNPIPGALDRCSYDLTWENNRKQTAAARFQCIADAAGTIVHGCYNPY